MTFWFVVLCAFVAVVRFAVRRVLAVRWDTYWRQVDRAARDAYARTAAHQHSPVRCKRKEPA